MLLDNGSTTNILFWDAYLKTGLIWVDLSPKTSPLYGFTGDHVISKGVIKLAVILGEHPRVATVVTEFLTINCPSSFNGVIGRLLLKALKATTSVHCLTMKFPTAVEIGQLWGRQWDSRECYNKSLELARKRERLPQVLEVEKTNKGPMETNIDPSFQEEESTAWPIEELIEIQVDPSELSWVMRISKELKSEVTQQLTKFPCHNQNMFAWTHADMVGIHPEIMCH